MTMPYGSKSKLHPVSPVSLAGIAAAISGNVPPHGLALGMPFERVDLDLSGADANTGISTAKAFTYDRPGESLYYRKEGSAPGGRLTIQSQGAFVDLYPGMRLDAPFERLDIFLGARSVATGKAALVVEKAKGRRAVEPATPGGQLFDPVDLLGVTKGLTFVSVALSLSPAVGDASFFNPVGFKRLRVLLNMNPDAAAHAFTSIVLTPWTVDQFGGQSFSNDLGNVTVPDSVVTQGVFRSLLLDITPGAGLMALVPSDPLSQGTVSTHVSMIVQGVE